MYDVRCPKSVFSRHLFSSQPLCPPPTSGSRRRLPSLCVCICLNNCGAPLGAHRPTSASPRPVAPVSGHALQFDVRLISEDAVAGDEFGGPRNPTSPSHSGPKPVKALGMVVCRCSLLVAFVSFSSTQTTTSGTPEQSIWRWRSRTTPPSRILTWLVCLPSYMFRLVFEMNRHVAVPKSIDACAPKECACVCF